METLNLVQGSAEWAAHRATARNASDAPAVLGCSPYTSRSQLLHAKHTGLRAEVTPEQQRRFDDGHAIEAMMRPYAEKTIGEDLYPVVGVETVCTRVDETDAIELSASFDGLTMLEDTGYECKTINDDLRAAFADMETIAPEHRERASGKALPKHYRVQMEQQLAVSGAQRILFVAANRDGSDVRHCWYYPDPSLRAEILAGWRQFDADLAAYVPPAAAAAPAVAAPVESLPAVQVRMDGALTIHSNLDGFGTALRAFIERIPAQPTSDQEFADCEAACKSLKKAEEALEAEEGRALAGMADVEKMRRMVADLAALARSTRLQREKLVKARKDQLRLEQVQRGRAALAKHLQALNQRLGAGYMPDVPADFAGVISGKKTMASIADAIDTELARAKIAANEVADRIQINMQALVAAGDKAGFPDAATLVLKAPDDLRAIIAQRVADAERKLAEQRERIRQEEEARAAAKVRQEQEAQQAEQRRQREEDEAELRRAEQAQMKHANGAPMFGATVKENGDRLMLSPDGTRSVFCDVDEDGESDQPGATVHPMPTRAPAAPSGPPTLRLGQINERLGFVVTADFLASLGYPMAGTEKAAKLWHEHSWHGICAAIAQHVVAVANGQKAVA